MITFASFYLFALFGLLLLSYEGQCAEFEELTNEIECTNLVATSSSEVVTSDLGVTMRKGFWSCAKDVALLLQSRGMDIRSHFDLEGRLIQKEITALKNAIESSLPQSSIVPAFQWAQSPGEVLLNVKFAHKLDAPATLNVEVSSVNLTSTSLILLASDGRKNFKLDLEFLKDVSPENSTWSMASVGRMTFNIKKQQEKPSNWPRLLKSKKKHPQMHFWWEMQEKYSKELEELEESEKKSKKGDSSLNNSTVSSNETSSSNDTSSNSESSDGNKPTSVKSEELSSEEKALNAERKKIDRDTAEKVKELEDGIRRRKVEIDNRAKEDKAALDKELDEQRKELRQASEAKKKSLTQSKQESNSPEL